MTIAQHIDMLDRATPRELLLLGRAFAAVAWPEGRPLRPTAAVRTVEIPEDASKDAFENALTASGLRAICERCWPTPEAQAQ